MTSLQKDDRILSINGVPMKKWTDVSETIRNSDGKELVLEIERDVDGKKVTKKIHLRDYQFQYLQYLKKL